MKTCLTRLTPTMITVFVTAIMMIISINSQAQSCACKESINVSLDASGAAVITAPDLLASGAPSNCTGSTNVHVMLTPTGNPIPGSPSVNCSHLGKTLYGKVIGGNNSCWSRIIVQDELRPTIVCSTAVMTMSCATFAAFVPTASDNCTPANELVLTFTESVTVNNCNNVPALPTNVLKRVVRTYTAKDKQGLVSNPCTITIDVTTIPNLNTITRPPSYNVAPGENEPLVCNGNWAKLDNGYPSPTPTIEGTITRPGTGVPTLGVAGPVMTDAISEACNLSVTYNDTKIPIGCTTKYLREWKVIEWSCQNRSYTPQVQIIEVVDNVGPTVAPIAAISASTSNHECAGRITFVAPTLTDNCSAANKLTYDINVYTLDGTPVASIKFGQPRNASLPKGQYRVEYVGYDVCYNKGILNVPLNIQDNTPPTVICDQFATVGLTNDGTGWVPASVLDDGSHDECLLDGFLVRRMTQNCGDCDLPKFDGFKYLGTVGTGVNKRYYYISEHEKNPSKALKRAKAMGGFGVSFETTAERTAVNNLVKACGDNQTYITGYTDLDIDGNYTWESGSTFVMPVNTGSSSIIHPGYTYIDADDNVLYRTDNEDTHKVVIEITDPCGWSSYTKFCCADVHPTNHQMVQFRAIDAEGNSNECMVSVIVQDKVGPTITCPANMSVTCDFVYDPRNLRKDFGWPTFNDNCENPTLRQDSLININSCRTGTISRTFTVTDKGGRSSSCTQVITFRPNPLLVYTGPSGADWPRDTTLVGCGDPDAPAFSPARLGQPRLGTGSCSLVGSDFEDQTFNFNNAGSPACFKILRKWTVIDWCKFAPNRNEQGALYPKDLTIGVNAWTDTQEIKVIDNQAPVIAPLAPVVNADTYDDNCEEGNINLTASATDVCTVVLKWRYIVLVKGVQYRTESGNGNTINASGVYPVGSHVIKYTFEDKCGNLSNAEQRFNIINKKAPTATVLNGLSINLSPTAPGEAEAEIWATDFDLKSSHPCGYAVKLSFTPFVKDTIKGSNGQDSVILVGTPNLGFDCDDIRRHPVTIYVASLTLDGVIVTTTVNTFIDVQDNNKACPTTNNNINLNVIGRIATENDLELQDVKVVLVGSEKELMTNDNGSFAFNNLLNGSNYVVTPYKNDDVLNGVSTLDIVMIQRHVLGIERLTSPFKMIAADVNKDGKVSAIDLIELRKVILGTSLLITNNTSWRFVDKNYQFIDIANAQGEAFPEVYPINNINTDMKTDFVSVKVGDVNGNATSAAQDNNTENRTQSTLSLYTDQSSVPAGNTMRIPVKVSDAAMLSGLQMTMTFDPTSLGFIDVEAANVDISAENLGTANVDRGQLTMSWNKANATTLKANDVLFYLVFETNNVTNAYNAVQISSDITVAEAYTKDGQVMDIKWSVRSATDYALYQNVPNPFKDKTAISYDLPQAMNATLTVYDLSGRTLRTVAMNAVKGRNQVTLDHQDLSAGVLYYTLRAGDFVSTRKMIVID